MKGERKSGGCVSQSALSKKAATTIGESSSPPSSASAAGIGLNTPNVSASKLQQQQQKYIYSEPALRNNYQVINYCD